MTNDLHAAIMNLPHDAEARLQPHSPAELFAYRLGHRDARHAAAELAAAHLSARPEPQAAVSEEREALQRAEKALTRLANIDCGCVPCTGQCRTGPAAEIELEGRMEYAHTEALAARAVLAASRQVPVGPSLREAAETMVRCAEMWEHFPRGLPMNVAIALNDLRDALADSPLPVG